MRLAMLRPIQQHCGAGTWKGGFASDLNTAQRILLHVYGDSVFSSAQVFQWFKAFSEGRESIEDEPRSGRPSSSRTDENVDRIHCAFRLWLDDEKNGEKLTFNHTTVHQILSNELGIRKIRAKMVPKNLSQEQKDIRRERCLAFWKRLKMIPISWNARPIEDFWALLLRKIYDRGWEAQNEQQLRRRIFEKLREIDLNSVHGLMKDIRRKLRLVEEYGPHNLIV
ncbi:hypothetical protein NQ318_015928 [Aromia moschata]|uniref:Mos1 transposase HTH domain-containing protein n=1 Tax=Aromia moschata TaxID=1265417 RepID=A0AAV8XRW2_9CUCU|nr:hypothetical protein NQ318_015928 [Aromia moschata]